MTREEELFEALLEAEADEAEVERLLAEFQTLADVQTTLRAARAGRPPRTVADMRADDEQRIADADARRAARAGGSHDLPGWGTTPFQSQKDRWVGRCERYFPPFNALLSHERRS